MDDRTQAQQVPLCRGAAMTSLVSWFDEVGKGDSATVGGKGANLGELARSGLPVPPGFVVTADAYFRSMEAGGVREELRSVFDEASRHPGDPVALGAAADRLRELVHQAGVANDVREQVLEAYRRLGDDVPVAVRSSATAEDAVGTSFAGMHETFVNVVGADALFERLVDCWASLYGARVISYRASQGLTEEPAIAVVVQQLVASERAGVLFTADPSTGDRSRIVVEGAFGLGEVVVGGEVEPDTYVLDKDGPQLVGVRVGHKDHKLVAAPDGTVGRVELDRDAGKRRVLSDEEAVELATLGLQVEAHYGEPQDIEWSLADGRTYLVQTPSDHDAGGRAGRLGAGLRNRDQRRRGDGHREGPAAGARRLAGYRHRARSGARHARPGRPAPRR